MSYSRGSVLLLATASARTDAERMSPKGPALAGYTLLDANLRLAAVHGLTFNAVVRNAFDTFYQHPAGTEHRLLGIPQDGRTLHVTISRVF